MGLVTTTPTSLLKTAVKIWIQYTTMIIHSANRWRFSNFILLCDYNLIKIHNFGSIWLTNVSLYIDPTDKIYGVLDEFKAKWRDHHLLNNGWSPARCQAFI